MGGFGKVVLGKHRENKSEVAIKFTDIGDQLSSAHMIQQIYKEAESLKALQHKNIVMAMKEYLQEEHQNIETKTMYAIARSIRLGNKRLGGVSYSSTHIDILVCGRILSDKVNVLDQMIDKYGETGEDGNSKVRVSD